MRPCDQLTNCEIDSERCAERTDLRASLIAPHYWQLAGHSEQVWHHLAADHRIRKRLVRLLIEEIVATVNEAEPSIDLVIHWKGTKHTALKDKNHTGQHSRVTQREVVEVSRQMPE